MTLNIVDQCQNIYNLKIYNENIFDSLKNTLLASYFISHHIHTHHTITLPYSPIYRIGVLENKKQWHIVSNGKNFKHVNIHKSSIPKYSNRDGRSLDLF